MSYLTIPKPNDNKNGQNSERKQFQSHSSGIVLLHIMLRFAINAIQKSQRKNREAFSPTFKPGKYSQASIHKYSGSEGHQGPEDHQEHQKILESEMGCCLSKQKQKFCYEKYCQKY
jgi:hypothetical protein